MKEMKKAMSKRKRTDVTRAKEREIARMLRARGKLIVLIETVKQPYPADDYRYIVNDDELMSALIHVKDRDIGTLASYIPEGRITREEIDAYVSIISEYYHITEKSLGNIQKVMDASDMWKGYETDAYDIYVQYDIKPMSV